MAKCVTCGKSTFKIFLTPTGQCDKCKRKDAIMEEYRQKQEAERKIEEQRRKLAEEKRLRQEREAERRAEAQRREVERQQRLQKQQAMVDSILSKTNGIPYPGKFVTGAHLNYTVVDLETTGLSPVYNRIVEIAALRVRDGKPQETFTTLVNPCWEIPSRITDINGISNEMVANAPTIEQVLPSFMEFLGDDLILGQNVEFDISFLYANTMYLDIPMSNDYTDTLPLARQQLPDLRNHKLGTLADHFGIDSTDAHRAGADCLMTHLVYQSLLAMPGPKMILAPTKMMSMVDTFDEAHPLYGKVCVLDGDFLQFDKQTAMQIVVNLGGKCSSSVSKKTSYFVVGGYRQTHKSTKHKDAEEQIATGSTIKIIPEATFWELVGTITPELLQCPLHPAGYLIGAERGHIIEIRDR